MRTPKIKNQRSVFARRRSDACPPGFYTAGMLRDRLNISLARFRALTTVGAICATKHNEANFALYSEEAVQALLNKQTDGTLFKLMDDPTSYTSEQSYQVFELLEAKVPMQQIVLKTRLLPQVVKRIQQEYDDMVGCIILPKSIVDQMNRLRTRLIGTFPLKTCTDILDVMTTAAEDRTCSECNHASCASLCVSCLRPRLVPASPQPETHANGHANGSSSPTAAVPPPPAPPSQNDRQP